MRLEKKLPGHAIAKALHVQNRGQLLKASREKPQVTYTGKPFSITTDFPTETSETRKAWGNALDLLPT